MITSLILSLLGCQEGFSGGADALLSGDVRGTPDPGLAIPPECVPGVNCVNVAVDAVPGVVAPDTDGGAWVTFPVGQSSDSDGLFELGGLFASFADNGLYGDTFLAHVDAGGGWDRLTGLGDANVSAISVSDDGEVAVIGNFYPQATLDGVSYACGTYDVDYWIGVFEADGSWRWADVLPRSAYTVLAPSAVLWSAPGEVAVAALGSGDIGGETVGATDPLVVARLDGVTGDALWTREVGIGVPTQLFADDDGALFLAGGGSYLYGGVVLGVDVPYPDLFMARVDGDADWVASTSNYDGWMLSGVWARVPDGGFVAGVGWNTASQPIIDGTLTFDGFDPIPMAMWEDGAMAGLSPSGAWRWANQSDASRQLVTMGERMWNVNETVGYDEYGNITGAPRQYCERVLDGGARGCLPADDVQNLAAGGGALWRVAGDGYTIERITP